MPLALLDDIRLMWYNKKMKRAYYYFLAAWLSLIHKFWVGYYLSKFAFKLLWRAVVHDLSKFSHFELKHHSRIVPTVRGMKYGSPEYKAELESIQPAVDYHHARNSHHPEYYKNGFADMSMCDLVELLCDWRAACRRHKPHGDVIRSIRINQEKYRYSADYKEMLEKIAKEIL